MLSESHKKRLKELSGIINEKFDFNSQQVNLSYLDIPGKYFYHVSSSKDRYSILKYGLLPHYKNDEYSKFLNRNPAVFVTDNINNLYVGGVGDVWQINRGLIKSEFFKDPNYESNHFYTLENIPPQTIKLIKKQQ